VTEFIGILRGITLKPYVEEVTKGVFVTRSCCSHDIRVEGDDKAMEDLYHALKGMFGKRVVCPVELEQPELEP